MKLNSHPSSHRSRSGYLGAIMATFCLLLGGNASAATPPNIVLIVADDLNYEAGFLGDPTVKTPHLDELAQRGVLFSRAYCQYPLCNPSRTSYLSGKRPETTRVVDNRTEPNRYVPELEFFSSFFQRKGYYTAAIGKVAQLSMDEMNSKGWDLYDKAGSALQNRLTRQFKQQMDQEGIPLAKRPYQYMAYDGDQEDELLDTARTHKFIKILDQAAQGDKPFLLSLGYHSPHSAWIVPKRFVDMYDANAIPLPPALPEGELATIPAVMLPPKDLTMTDEDIRQARRGYYASISYMDDLIGQVMDAMTRLDLWDNTIVVFVSDHGWSTGQHAGRFSKGALWRVEAEAPLIIRALSEKGNGQTCQRVVEFIDIYPTLVQLCGYAEPSGLEGNSLVPLLENPSAPWDHFAQTTMLRGTLQGCSIATEDYHYVQWGEAGKAGRLLYKISEDPEELHNLAGDPAYAEKMDELQSLVIVGDAPLERNDLDKISAYRWDVAPPKVKNQQPGDSDD